MSRLVLCKRGNNGMSVEHVSIGSEKELQQIVMNELHTIQRDLTVICTNVPVDEKTKLDVLCHDQNGQLVILELSVQRDDNIVFEGLRCLEYIERVKGLLTATYTTAKINTSEKPRLIIVAPSFSDTMLNLAKYITGVQVDLYEWEYLKIDDRKGLCVHSVWWEPWQKQDEKRREEKPVEKKPSKEKKSQKAEQPKHEEQKPQESQQPQEPEQSSPAETPVDLWKPEEPSKPAQKPKEEESRKKLKLF